MSSPQKYINKLYITINNSTIVLLFKHIKQRCVHVCVVYRLIVKMTSTTSFYGTEYEQTMTLIYLH